MNHYVYFITNEDKMKYIGVRSSECSPEEDDKYWGSSKYTPKDICDTGVKEIVEVFATREEAVALEIELHNKWNVAVNPWFYNQAKQTSTGFDTQGCTKENNPSVAAAAALQKGRTKENHPGVAAQAEKMKGRTKETHPGVAAQAEKMLGKECTEETKAKLSAATTGDKNPNADVEKYWFIHKLYGLVWCTRYYLRTHFNKPDRIKALFHKKPRKHCAGWSLYIGGDLSQSIT